MTLELMLQEAEEKAFKQLIEEGFFDQGFEEGFRQGFRRGYRQGFETVAKNLIDMGMSFEDICKVTKLSTERIKELAKSIKN